MDCTYVQPWPGTLCVVSSSLMSLFDVLIFNREDILPCKTEMHLRFHFVTMAPGFSPVLMATVYTSSQDRLILFLSA